MSSDDADRVSSKDQQLHGTTLRAYWFIFRSGKPVGVRETQRALSLSSPSTALYHLEKMRELAIVEKDNIGQYFLKDNVQIGSLKMFLRVGHLLLPRYLFYAVFLTTATVVFAILEMIIGGNLEVAAILFGFAGAAISWYESFRMWKERII